MGLWGARPELDQNRRGSSLQALSIRGSKSRKGSLEASTFKSSPQGQQLRRVGQNIRAKGNERKHQAVLRL